MTKNYRFGDVVTLAAFEDQPEERAVIEGGETGDVVELDDVNDTLCVRLLDYDRATDPDGIREVTVDQIKD